MSRKLCSTLLIAAAAFWLMLDKPEFNYEVLSGLNVLLTGASSGIGEEIAYTYARHGANVVIVARREEKLKQVLSKCKKLSPNKQPNFHYIVADLGNVSKTKQIVQEAVTFLGGLDHLVLNHAYMEGFRSWDVRNMEDNLAYHAMVMRINYESFVHLASHAMTHLQKTNGSISVSGSVIGRTTFPYSTAYAASKYALDGFFGSLRWELNLRKVNVSATYCVIGRVGTDAGHGVVDSWVNAGFLNKGVFDKYNPAHPVADTADAMVKATHQRQRELYYPPSQNIFIQSLMRIVAPGPMEKALTLLFGF